MSDMHVIQHLSQMREALFHSTGNNSIRNLMYKVNVSADPKKADTLIKKELSTKLGEPIQKFKRVRKETDNVKTALRHSERYQQTAGATTVPPVVQTPI
jgi:hypothetical protein